MRPPTIPAVKPCPGCNSFQKTESSSRRSLVNASCWAQRSAPEKATPNTNYLTILTASVRHGHGRWRCRCLSWQFRPQWGTRRYGEICGTRCRSKSAIALSAPECIFVKIVSVKIRPCDRDHIIFNKVLVVFWLVWVESGFSVFDELVCCFVKVAPWHISKRGDRSHQVVEFCRYMWPDLRCT